MTILTKAVGDKKIDKSDLPLVTAIDVSNNKHILIVINFKSLLFKNVIF